MNKGLNVHSEIGALKKVCVHRPGMDLVNMKAEDFDRVWIHDAFYLDYAQKEHDQFTDLLRGAGAEVVYMEDLVAETFDKVEGARAQFMGKFMDESGIKNAALRQAVVEKLDSIKDNKEFVLTAMGGLYVRDLEIPHVGGSLASLDGDELKGDDMVLFPMPASYFSRDPPGCRGQGRYHEPHVLESAQSRSNLLRNGAA